MFKTASASVAGFAASMDSRGRTASRVKVGSFEYEPAGPDYLYVSLRALSADRPNLNMDMFPSDELREAHKTFVGSCVFLEHDNRDPEKSRGAIIASKFHEEDPDDKWVEILMELDERRCPKLCSMIRSGEINTFSMGCEVDYSECPICGKTAEQPWQFCEHMRNKGREYDGKLAYEICHGIDFFEESVVYNPADPTARAIEVSGDSGDAAPRTGEWFDELGTWVLEDPSGVTLTADDNGFWFALDGSMNELGCGECRSKDAAKKEAEDWMVRHNAGRAAAGRGRQARAASRTAWKSRDLSKTDELRQLRWRPTGKPVATGVDEPLCWYPVHGIDSICADYGRGFVCCRAYESVSGRTNITIDYIELESPSSLVATGRSVSIGVLHCKGFEPTGAEFLEAAKRADAWAKSREGVGYAFSSRTVSAKRMQRVATGNISEGDIVIDRMDNRNGYLNAYGHVYVRDLPRLSFIVSNIREDLSVSMWLSDPSSGFDFEKCSVWCEHDAFDYDEISEKLGVDWKGRYDSIADEDAVKAAVSLFLDETSIPDDAWEEYYDLLDEDEDASSSWPAPAKHVQWEVINDGETLEGSMNGVNFFAQLVNYGYGDESDEWEMFAYVLDPTDPYNEDAIWDSRGDADDPKTLNESGTPFRMRGVDYRILDECASYLYGLAVEAVGGKAKVSQAVSDGWSQTDNGDGTTTYTDQSGDTATVSPHESGQGYGYEVKGPDGSVKGYGWAQTADEAAQKAKDAGQQQASASRAGTTRR